MSKKIVVPDLLVKHVSFEGREVPWDLKIFMYQGGSAKHARFFERAIQAGELGQPLLERLDLVVKIHEFICDRTAAGEPRLSTAGLLRSLRLFFKFADEECPLLTLETLEDCYLQWTASLRYRVRIKGAASFKRDRKSQRLTIRSANYYASNVGQIVDAVLGRATGIMQHAGLAVRNQRKSVSGVQSEKQSLSDTFTFGHMLQDICDALTIDVINNSALPLEINLRNGKRITLSNKRHDCANSTFLPLSISRIILVNVRIEAELLMFIAQTSMNSTQAKATEFRHFSYKSHLDGYQVKEYKARRGGEVLFEIFREYKAHFEHYLTWRHHFFPESNRLFPFIYTRGGCDGDFLFGAERLRRICTDLEAPFISPQKLRNTRVNWMLRESGSTEQTAEIAQHKKETLLRVYHLPSLQRAIAESNDFWTAYDPHSDAARFTLANERTQEQPAAGPGSCVGEPQKLSSAPAEAPKPDCLKKSGCLWCNSHRDVDSFEYVWSLATFRQLKLIEVAKSNIFIKSDDMPLAARRTLEKIDSRLIWFENVGDFQKEWVDRARELIFAGEYHPDYASLIDFLEGR